MSRDAGIRVLVADGSAASRAALTDMLARQPGLAVVGTAADSAETRDKTVSLAPDIILIEWESPRLNGIETARIVMDRCPTPIVLATAGQPTPEQLQAAIAAGALAVVAKPLDAAVPTARLVETLRLMAGVAVVRRRLSRRPAADVPQVVPSRVEVIAIAGSTGAPRVIAELLGALGRSFPVPIMLVQHLADGFLDGFAASLNRAGGPRVVIPASGTRLEGGTAYLAPHGRQMGIAAPRRIELGTDEEIGGFCPSATYLFNSVARVCGDGAIGIILTGMGGDGAEGLLAMRRAGAVTLAQDEASSAVWGMPGEAVRIGGAVRTLPPPEIAAFLTATFGPAPTRRA